MGHYKSNVRDIEFNLFEVFGTARTLETAPFAAIEGAGDIAVAVDAREDHDGCLHTGSPASAMA